MTPETAIVLAKSAKWKTDVVNAARECGTLQRAAELAGVPLGQVKSMLKHDIAFKEAVDEALGTPAGRLFHIMLRRALNGDQEALIDARKGVCMGPDGHPIMVTKYDTRLQVEMSKALMPEKFREPKALPAGQDGRQLGARPRLDELFAALGATEATPIPVKEN